MKRNKKRDDRPRDLYDKPLHEGDEVHVQLIDAPGIHGTIIKVTEYDTVIVQFEIEAEEAIKLA